MQFGNSLTDETKQAFADEHPECWTSFDGKQLYGYGWRYDDNGYTYSKIYKHVREVFDMSMASTATSKEKTQGREFLPYQR